MNCKDCGAEIEPDHCRLRPDYCAAHYAQRLAYNAHERTPGWLKREGVGVFYTGPLPAQSTS